MWPSGNGSSSGGCVSGFMSEVRPRLSYLVGWCRSGYPGHSSWSCSRSDTFHFPRAFVLTFFTGFLFSKLMKLSHKRGFIDRESFVAQYLALAIFTMGVASTIGVDDLLASFAAGQRHFCLQYVMVSPCDRLCNLMGWPLQCSDGRRFVLVCNRLRSQLCLLHLYRRLAPF